MSAIYVAAISWGIAMGFSHCIGMCGIFVLACGPGEKAGAANGLSSTAMRQILFQIGRLISLSLLGALGGSLGSLAAFAVRYARLQGWIAVLVGVLLCGLALGQLGVVPFFRIPEPDVLGAGDGKMRKLYVRAFRSQSLYKPGLLGILVGLLPCGLTYTFLITAAGTLSAVRGLTVMSLFWLGTVPGLLALGMSGTVLSSFLSRPNFRIWMTRVGGVILFITGTLMAVRGWPYTGF